MTQGIEHFFKYFLAIQNSSVENSLFRSAPHLLIGLFEFLVFNFLSSLTSLDISLLSNVGEDLFPVCRLPVCPNDSYECGHP